MPGAPDPARDRLGQRARAVLAALFDQHEARVFGFLLARTGDLSLAEDLTTETFLAIARRAATEPDSIDRLTASAVVTIAHRRLVDHWRAEAARTRRLRVASGAATEDPTEHVPGAAIDARDERVLAALRALPASHRAALALRYLDELPVAEVAEILDLSYRATESVLARARRGFRDAYEQETERP